MRAPQLQSMHRANFGERGQDNAIATLHIPFTFGNTHNFPRGISPAEAYNLNRTLPGELPAEASRLTRVGRR